MKLALVTFCSLVIITTCTVKSQDADLAIYSASVKDSFDINIDVKEATPGNPYHVVYYLDANLKSGKIFKQLIKEYGDSLNQNTLFVGIGHRGRYDVKRRRDFIPPVLIKDSVSESGNPDYAHANAFYAFMENELIPMIESGYSVHKERTIIGHSFGGLFAVYCMLKQKPLFNRYIALSPSIWVNDYNILEYEEQYYKTTGNITAYLFLSAGSNERINKIIPGVRKMKQVIDMRKYGSLVLEYKEIPGASHNSQVEKSLNYLLTMRKL